MVALFAAVVGVIAAFGCLSKIYDLLSRESRQQARFSGVIAYFLVSGIGLSFASFVRRSNETFYSPIGAAFADNRNPITWRVENAPSLNAIPPELILTAVILIGFMFLGAVAFFLALMTMFRFDSAHPQHNGAYKDCFMYTIGGVATTNIAGLFNSLGSFFPPLASTAAMLTNAADRIFQ